MTCALCGRAPEEHDRHVTYRLPEPVLRLPERERTPGTWLSADDPARAVLMQAPGLGGFVRALLPVRLSGGYVVTYGVWVGVHPDDLRRAFDAWWAPAYADLALDGRLANVVEPWGLLGAPLTARVEDPERKPYVVASTDAALSRVLAGEWPHEEILRALPG